MSEKTLEVNEAADEQATEPATFFTRRHLMKGTAGAVGVAALGGLGLWYGTQPSLAATTYTQDGDSLIVETNAGEVQDIRVAPVFDLSWTDFGGGASNFDFTITATVGGASETVYDETGMSDATSGDIETFTTDGLSVYDGNVTVSCAPLTILGTNITTDSFPTNVASGTTQSATVTLTLSATGNQDIGSAVDAEDATLTFDVVVDNPAGSATATITASNAEGDGADTADETTTTV